MEVPMASRIRLEVWGDFASFNRPEMKVERVSYDLITPSAARGILEAIYWKPQMRWVVDEIRVLRPIRFAQVRRNEIATKVPIKGASGVGAAMRSGRGALGLEVDDSANRVQRAAIVLRDVKYGIGAHVEVLNDRDADGIPLVDAEAKHLDMFRRRAEKGQCFHHPYLGTREFPAEFRLVREFEEVPDELRGERDLGWMLREIDFIEDATGPIVESSRGRRVTARPRFFRAVLRDGVLDGLHAVAGVPR
jgi:CRISPR-associated protein Cas5d